MAAIYGAELWRGVPLLIFEYLEGGTLAERLRRGPLPIADVARLGIHLAHVLTSAHAHGVLHGDIKPSNIGFAADGTPKMLDLGLARLLRSSRDERPQPADTGGSTATTSGWTPPIDAVGVAGTLAYLSPEALDEEPPDPAVDLWSLSVVLYEAIAGISPFMSTTALDTMIHIRQADPPLASRLRPDCPATVAGFLQRALNRDRSVRPATAHLYQQQLELAAAAILTGTNPGIVEIV